MTGNDSASERQANLDPELATRLAQVREREEKRAKLRRQIVRERRILLPLLVIVLMALPNFRMGKVQGKSMEPLLFNNDNLVILKTYRYLSPLRVGDIVVLQLKHGKGTLTGEELVKRVVFIQNATHNAPWPRIIENARGQFYFRDAFPQYVDGHRGVPPHMILVLGDNVDNSTDSRQFGPVDSGEIIGKVVRFYH